MQTPAPLRKLTYNAPGFPFLLTLTWNEEPRPCRHIAVPVCSHMHTVYPTCSSFPHSYVQWRPSPFTCTNNAAPLSPIQTMQPPAPLHIQTMKLPCLPLTNIMSPTTVTHYSLPEDARSCWWAWPCTVQEQEVSLYRTRSPCQQRLQGCGQHPSSSQQA